MYHILTTLDQRHMVVSGIDGPGTESGILAHTQSPEAPSSLSLSSDESTSSQGCWAGCFTPGFVSSVIGWRETWVQNGVMFTKKEPAFAEVWTGANPTARFQSLLNAFLQEGNSRKRPMSLVAKSSLR
ncbi:hypothetical protein PTI98_009165 [Pleurotus ostreatus]|nr:hypothetical protein PTI98_009165 [Pleurotus ostreatus]